MGNLESIWEASGKHLGRIWEAFGKAFGRHSWKVRQPRLRRHPGRIWEAFGKHLEGRSHKKSFKLQQDADLPCKMSLSQHGLKEPLCL